MEGRVVVGPAGAEEAWEVRVGRGEVLARHEDERSAVRAGIDLARSAGSELVVHRADGSIAWQAWF